MSRGFHRIRCNSAALRGAVGAQQNRVSQLCLASNKQGGTHVSSKKTLVAAGAGYVGSHVVHPLRQADGRGEALLRAGETSACLAVEACTEVCDDAEPTSRDHWRVSVGIPHGLCPARPPTASSGLEARPRLSRRLKARRTRKDPWFRIC